MGSEVNTDVVVVGGGPGGYAAAFYAADMGHKVVLIEEGALGGVCLNTGCIPSKALLHAVHVMEEAKHASDFGITYAKPKIALDKLRSWKADIVKKLSGGIGTLAKGRGVTVIKGRGLFDDSNTIRVDSKDGQRFVKYKKAIVAVGSKPALPAAFDLGQDRVMTSTDALELKDIPGSLLVIGGGYIGMELGTVYAGLGSKVTVVEALDSILAGADDDLVRPVMKHAKAAFEDVRLSAKVVSMATSGKQIKVVTESKDGKKSEELFDRVLVSVGRSPNTFDLGLDNTTVKLDDRGFIKVNDQMQTDDSSIFAIGDVIGGAMLAHKASKEARVAVEVISEQPAKFDNVIPCVVFTSPEVAWVGLTEKDAKAEGKKVKVAKFPWAALGRALTLGHGEGTTKIIADPDTERVLGVGIVGPSAGDLISEAALAIEMGATVADIAETIHPHPTLGESMMEAAEVFFGHSSHFK